MFSGKDFYRQWPRTKKTGCLSNPPYTEGNESVSLRILYPNHFRISGYTFFLVYIFLYINVDIDSKDPRKQFNIMIKKPYRAIFLLLISLSVSACRLQNAQEYSRDFIRIYSGSLLPSLLRDIFTSSAYYCLILIPAGVLLFLLSLILFLFNRNEKSLPLLGVSALMVSALYAAPYLTLLKSLPNQEILILQIRTVSAPQLLFCSQKLEFHPLPPPPQKALASVYPRRPHRPGLFDSPAGLVQTGYSLSPLDCPAHSRLYSD